MKLRNVAARIRERGSKSEVPFTLKPLRFLSGSTNWHDRAEADNKVEYSAAAHKPWRRFFMLAGIYLLLTVGRRHQNDGKPAVPNISPDPESKLIFLRRYRPFLFFVNRHHAEQIVEAQRTSP